MKIFLHNRKDFKVFQNSAPMKVYCESGNEYVLPQVDENGRYEVQFIKKSEFTGALWFVKALLFWIVGIMGFFTPKYAKCNHSLDCKISGIDDGNPINVSFTHPNSKYKVGEGVKVRQERVNVQGAEYIVDKTAAKRKKIYNFLSGISRLAIIILAVVIVIKAIIG